MNLSGLTQYSKAVSGMRQPQNLKGQNLNLMFIYPILMANKVKVQSSTPFETLIRDFISTTFLNQIFIENAIQMVSTANQIRPLWDESGAKVNPAGILLSIASQNNQLSGQVSTSPTGGTAPPIYNVDSGDNVKSIIQQKIKQKTAVIQQYMKSDPRLARFRPYIEMITLGNMIEVPVIAGTAFHPIDTLTLFHVLVGAIALNKPLDNMANVDYICDQLETLTPQNYYRLLHNLFPQQSGIPFTSAVFNNIMGRFPMKHVSRYASRTRDQVQRSVSNRYPGATSVFTNLLGRKEQKGEVVSQFERSDPVFDVLNMIRQNIDQTKLFFKFVLDEAFAASRYGINPTTIGSKQSSINSVISTQLSKKLGQIIDNVNSTFLSLISTTGTVVLRSVSNAVTPLVGSEELNFSDLKSEFIDHNLMNQLTPSISSLVKLIEDTTSSSDIDMLKNLCSMESSDVLKDINELILQTSLTSTSFTDVEYKQFLAGLDRSADICGTFCSKFEKTISQISYREGDQSGNEALSYLKNMKGMINEALNKIFSQYKDIHSTQTPAADAIVKNPNITIKACVNSLTDIYYFMLLSTIQENLCKFIIIANVEIETKTNEVTTWPNYTLILPIEFMTALHAAIMAKGWDKLIHDERSGTPLTRDQVGRGKLFSVNDTSYVQGVIGFISNRLNIPNLIVVDGKQDVVYYQLMNSNDINRVKVSTLETFVQTMLSKPLDVQTQSYY